MREENDAASPHKEHKLEIMLIAIVVSGVLGFSFCSWRQGSDRAACILNQRNVQQAVRSHQGMRGRCIGDAIDWSEIIGPGKFLDRVDCPGGGIYRFASKHPAVGTLAMECSLCDKPHRHVPDSHAYW
jgi:hypothetical protein